MAVFKNKIRRSWSVLNVLSFLMQVLSEKNACLLISSQQSADIVPSMFTKRAALTT